MAAIDKLLDIQKRLSTMMEGAEKENEPLSKELNDILQSLNNVISELSRPAPQALNAERELARVTSKPIQPSNDPGPHHVSWKPKS